MTSSNATEARNLPRRLSPSRAADFVTCPLLYRLRTIDRIDEPRDPIAVRGTLIHAALERLFEVEPHRRTIDHARRLVATSWEQLQSTEPELAELFTADADQSIDPEAEWIAQTQQLIESYFELEDPRRVEPAEREIRLEHQTPSGLTLAGIADRIDVAPDGRIRIIDYKSGRSPGPFFEDKVLAQLRFYALVVWRTRQVVPTVLQLYYLRDQTVLSYEPTIAELEATERRLEAIWAAISSGVDTGQFPPKPSALCKFCHHHVRCPTFGGIVPSMPPVLVGPSDDALGGTVGMVASQLDET